MKKNMHSIDRLLRAALALVLIGLYLAGILSGTEGVIALIVSGILLLTSFSGVCPLYVLTGIRTRTSARH